MGGVKARTSTMTSFDPTALDDLLTKGKINHDQKPKVTHKTIFVIHVDVWLKMPDGNYDSHHTKEAHYCKIEAEKKAKLIALGLIGKYHSLPNKKCDEAERIRQQFNSIRLEELQIESTVTKLFPGYLDTHK